MEGEVGKLCAEQDVAAEHVGDDLALGCPVIEGGLDREDGDGTPELDDGVFANVLGVDLAADDAFAGVGLLLA